MEIKMNKEVKIVCGGSGILYPGIAGCLIRLAEEGFSFKEFTAVSGSALVCAAIASGYKPNSEITKLVKATLPAKNNLIDLSLWSLFTKWGLIGGDKIEEVFDKHLSKTFLDLKIPLNVIATNVDKKKQVVFSPALTPEMSVSKALRASMGIPVIFTPIKIKDEHYVDGGLMSNFPIDYFKNDPNVIGIRFNSPESKYKPIKSIKDYLLSLINSMIEANMEDDIEDCEHPNIIYIKTTYSSLSFNIVDSDCDAIINSGYKAADAWIIKQKSKGLL